MKAKYIACAMVAISAAIMANATASVMSLGNVADNGGGNYTISSGLGSVPDANIETWLGLPLGTLDSMAVTTDPDLVTEGSAMMVTEAMAAGDTLSFDWVWTSDENTLGQPPQFNDFSFYTLTFQGAFVITNRFAPNGTSGTVSWTAPTAGTMTLGVGVVDVGDTAVDSWLNVDNIVIPEPATFSLIGVVAGGFVFVRRRLKA
jgi:hypothetical protein